FGADSGQAAFKNRPAKADFKSAAVMSGSGPKRTLRQRSWKSWMIGDPFANWRVAFRHWHQFHLLSQLYIVGFTRVDGLVVLLGASYRPIAKLSFPLDESLTDREREVMSAVANGLMNKQIALLGVREITVKLHRARVMKDAGDFPRWYEKLA
ncbi:LuxR C-terminal-related transcriptional regulator, partial [Phyllobacterium sp. P5_D12]